MLAATLAPLRLVRPAPLERREGLAQVPDTDAELVARFRGGDEWAKEALYRRYFQSVWGLVLRLLGNRHDAEDVVQDTFVLALQDIHLLREPERFGPWLVRIAVHQVHRRFRRRRLYRALGITTGVEDAALDVLALQDASPEVRAELAKIARVLAELPAPQRIAWMLRYVEGCSLEETAERTACSLATAKRRIAAASVRVMEHVAVGTAWLDGGEA